MKVVVFLLSLVTVSLACHPQDGGSGSSGGSSGGHHGGGGHHGRALPQKRPKEENGGDDEGRMCADSEMIGHICLAGTTMGEKMMAAIKTCVNTEVQMDDTDRKRKIPKGKGKNKGQKGKGGKGGRGKCPSSQEIMETINNQTADHRCVMKEMGWVDAEGKVSLTSEVAMNDLKSLHPSVLENMDQEGVKNCHKKSMDEIKKSSLYKKCKNKYSEDEESKIKDVMSKMITGKCSKKILMKSCSKHVADSFMSFMKNQNSA